MILPMIYSSADLGLRIALGVPAPQQSLGLNFMTWGWSVAEAWTDQVARIKRALNKNPDFYIKMASLVAMNPHWGGGKAWNPISWETGGPFYLDTLPYGDRPATHMAKRDWRLGEHQHQTWQTKQPNFFNRWLFDAKEIEIIENWETAGSKSMREYQESINIYTPDKPFPEYMTPEVRTKEDATAYKKLFQAQQSTTNGSPGKAFYKPVKSVIKGASSDFAARMERARNVGYNYFDGLDDPKTGWALSEKQDMWLTNNAMQNRYAQAIFYIYDLRQKKYLLLPTSIRSWSENITPSWSEEEYMGRVDDVATYIKTVKEYNFDLVFSAQNPVDYLVMWRKIGLLQSFAYPQYNSDATRINAPIVRLRLGDLIRRKDGGPESEGVAGFFRSFVVTTDETMTVWQTTEDELSLRHGTEKLGIGPRLVELTFNFKVLHDTSYETLADGTVNFWHDAVYKDGYHSTKLAGSYGARQPAQSQENTRDVVKEQPNSRTDSEEADRAGGTDHNARGDLFSPCFGPDNTIS